MKQNQSDMHEERVKMARWRLQVWRLSEVLSKKILTNLEDFMIAQKQRYATIKKEITITNQ